MTGYLLGILGFISLFVFDLLSFYNKKKSKYVFMLIGVGALVIGSTLLALAESTFSMHIMMRILFAVMAVFFFCLLVYSVAIEVGKNTYQYHHIPKLVTSGTYALSRHPGVLWLFFFYVSLGFALTSYALLLGALVFTLVNTSYVYVQEKFIFIHIFEEYPNYQQQTPFILPTYKSIKAFIQNT